MVRFQGGSRRENVYSNKILFAQTILAMVVFLRIAWDTQKQYHVAQYLEVEVFMIHSI